VGARPLPAPSTDPFPPVPASTPVGVCPAGAHSHRTSDRPPPAPSILRRAAYLEVLRSCARWPQVHPVILAAVCLRLPTFCLMGARSVVLHARDADCAAGIHQHPGRVHALVGTLRPALYSRCAPPRPDRYAWGGGRVAREVPGRLPREMPESDAMGLVRSAHLPMPNQALRDQFMLSPTIQVFVSSTSWDLQAERHAVEAAVQRMRETKFVGMEYFGSRDNTTKDASLQELDRSDLYIGIFGGRYGSGITEDEYCRAQARGLDRLIYFKDDAAILPEQRESDSEMAARLARLKQDLRREHVVSVFATADDLAAKVTADLHRWLVDKRLTTPREHAYSMRAQPAPVEPEDQRGVRDLLHKVHTFWIEGVLQHSIHGVVLIEIGKKSLSEAVEHPWERVLEVPGQSSQIMPRNKSIGDIFRESGQSLLILGEPGSGKTTTLLELGRHLLLHAQHDPSHPVPVVFNLSSWARQSIFDWLVDELSTKYFVAKHQARSWLRANRLLPLLDGLDEVTGDARTACVTSINRFAQDVGVPGLAVSSRTNEYVALGARLRLHAAICLQPLTPEQVKAYVSEAGPELGALSAALQEDAGLQSLAQSPLMLAVMSLAYRGASIERLASEQPPAGETQQGHVLAAYVDRMFARMGRATRPYAKEQSVAWLSWLAQNMREHSQSIFLIEQIQPSWLAGRGKWLLYPLMSRIVAGLLYGLIGGVSLRCFLSWHP
jgi:hypothetical protein